MESKEALENLTYCVNGMESKEKYYSIIKQDLERLEELEAKDKKWQELFGCDLCEALGRELLREENVKLKHALYIIKRKHIQFYFLSITKNVDKYNALIKNDMYDYLIQEEYELLKEVLENEN